MGEKKFNDLKSKKILMIVKTLTIKLYYDEIFNSNWKNKHKQIRQRII